MSSATAGTDVLIVTALQLERMAVRRHLADLDVIQAHGVVADAGLFTVDTTTLRITVIETGAGNVHAAIAAQTAESTWKPRQVIMLGVAGGLKDVAIADVVASSKVYWIEGGKEARDLRPRPDQAPVSPGLVQLARTVAADGRWLARADATGGGSWPGAGRQPKAIVGAMAAGERVLTDPAGRTAELMSQTYGDALTVDMEDFGALRAAASGERARTLAVRGVSDLLLDKAHTDAGGAQPLAAANAAAFAFELLALDVRLSGVGESASPTDLLELASDLYPRGPLQNAVWERAGGDVSRLELSGTGRTMWWNALRLLDRGGGGDLSPLDLLRAFAEDHPQHPALTSP